jgi:hypothetical protein
MGLAKCSNIIGMPIFACFMRHCGVNLSFASASSWMVSTYIACLVTILCQAPLEIGMNVVGEGIACILCDLHLTPCVLSCCSKHFCPNAGQLRVSGLMILTRWIAGTAPGDLFLVFRQCKRGMFFNTRFAVEFHNFILGGASMMRGTVRIGVLSITLCCCILTLCSCSLASCSVIPGVGSTICLILLWRSLMRRLPVGVLFAVALSLASSSVSAQKCWSEVKFGNWQCCGNNSIDPNMQYALVSGM